MVVSVRVVVAREARQTVAFQITAWLGEEKCFAQGSSGFALEYVFGSSCM